VTSGDVSRNLTKEVGYRSSSLRITWSNWLKNRVSKLFNMKTRYGLALSSVGCAKLYPPNPSLGGDSQRQTNGKGKKTVGFGLLL
jgi:hypothetical protein